MSKTTASTSLTVSKAFLSRMRIPLFAVIEVDRATTKGIAKPSACGHAITRTVTVRVSANCAFPSNAHTP